LRRKEGNALETAIEALSLTLEKATWKEYLRG
jgi:hypothetical protein